MGVISPPYQLPELRPFRQIANQIRLSGGAVVTDHGELKSDDFTVGVVGWIVRGDGTVEFNDGVFRGTVDAAALNLTISASDDGAVEFYNASAVLVGRLSADSWEIGDLVTPGLRATLDPLGGLRFRDEADELVGLLDHQGLSVRDPTTGNVVAEIGRTGIVLKDAATDEGFLFSASSVSTLAKPRYVGNYETAPLSSIVIPAATKLTVNDLELGHMAAYKRGTAQAATWTPPSGWTESIDNDYGSASTLATSVVYRSPATGTTGTATSSQSNWDSAASAHVIVRGVPGGTTPSIRSSSTVELTTTDNSVNLTMTKPSGTAANDVLVIFVAMGNAAGYAPIGWTTPTGWVFQGAQTVTTGTGATTSTIAVGTWARLADASEPATYETNVQFMSGTKTVVGHMLAIQNGAVVGGGPSLEVLDENFLGPMKTYTPTNSNVTVGNGTEVAKYLRMGKLCFVSYQLTWGTTTSYSPTYADFGIPFQSFNGIVQVMSGHLFNGGSKEYPGIAKIQPNGSYARLYHGIDTGTGNISSTVPFTWATGDILTFEGWYELA